jgi:hypothetical protein
MTRDDEKSSEPDPQADEREDEVDEESFPASDPPSSWAGTNPDSED